MEIDTYVQDLANKNYWDMNFYISKEMVQGSSKQINETGNAAS